MFQLIVCQSITSDEKTLFKAWIPRSSQLSIL